MALTNVSIVSTGNLIMFMFKMLPHGNSAMSLIIGDEALSFTSI